MVHPTYKKQVEIERKIRSYLGLPGELGKTWSELAAKAKKDDISKTTLSRYLKRFIEEDGSVIQDVNLGSHPLARYYRRNEPRPITERKKKDEMLEKQLNIYKKYAAKGEHGAIGYYDKFIWMLFDMIAIHVWASKFQNPKKAAKWICVMTQIMLTEWYNLGQEAPILMKHCEAIRASAKDYLIYFLSRFPKGRLKSIEPKFIEDYLAFNPTPGLSQEK